MAVSRDSEGVVVRDDSQHSSESQGGPPKRSYESFVQAAGAVAGFGLVVALLGGAIVWERLHTLHLPANPIAAELPRTLFLVVGARALAFPVALGAGVLLVGGILRRPAASGWLRLHQTPRRVGAGAIVIFAVILGIVTHALVQQWLFIAVAIAVVGFTAAAAVRGDRQLSKRWLAWSFVVVASFSAVVEVIDIARPPVKLEFARIELVGGGAQEGFFVGENSTEVYLAPADRGCRVRGRVDAIPRSRVLLLSLAASRNAYRRGVMCTKKSNTVNP